MAVQCVDTLLSAHKEPGPDNPKSTIRVRTERSFNEPNNRVTINPVLYLYIVQPLAGEVLLNCSNSSIKQITLLSGSSLSVDRWPII